MNLSFIEALNKLNQINEETETLDANGIPDEIAQMIKAGVPVLTELPDFLKDEVADEDLAEDCYWPYKQLESHYNSHVLNRRCKLEDLESNNPDYEYRFSSMITLQDYKDLASNLADAEIDGTSVFGFICQDTLRVNSMDKHSAAKKFSTGESRTNRATSFRVCKFRLNDNLYLDNKDVYSKNQYIPEDYEFNFADHDVAEVVFYAYNSRTYSVELKQKVANKVIVSYLPKAIHKAMDDLGKAERAYDPDTTLRRFSNQVNVRKLATTAIRQPVVIVLSFETVQRRLQIRLDYYNDAAKAQQAYAENLDAFLILLFNGTEYNLLTGKIYPEPKTRRENLLHTTQAVNSPNRYSIRSSARLEKIATWIQSICLSMELNGTILPEELIEFLNEATDKAEAAYAKDNDNKSMYRHSENGSDLLATVRIMA